MFRAAFDTLLLAGAATLLIAGIAAWPEISDPLLGGIVAVAGLMLAPVGAGHRTTETTTPAEVAR